VELRLGDGAQLGFRRETPEIVVKRLKKFSEEDFSDDVITPKA
jgi:hypothetical protein